MVVVQFTMVGKNVCCLALKVQIPYQITQVLASCQQGQLNTCTTILRDCAMLGFIKCVSSMPVLLMPWETAYDTTFWETASNNATDHTALLMLVPASL